MGLRIPINAPPITSNQIGWLEAGLRSLRGTGLTDQQELSSMLLCSGFVRSDATLMADFAVAAATAGSVLEQVMPAYARTLLRLTDAERFPALHEAIASGAFDDDDDLDAEFDFGLERLLDGIAALVSARVPKP